MAVISKLYIDEEVKDLPEVLSVQSKINAPASVINNIKELFEIISCAKDSIGKGKEILFLTRNKGQFLRNCPGTRDYICCDYKILHIGTFCFMDCSYCILQAYFHPPLLQFFVNHQDLFALIDQMFSQSLFGRIGTGEFTDSLIWELWTNLASQLVMKFSRQSKMVLELKTKTTAIDNLKSLDHNKKTIIAWSLNTEEIIRTDERRTSSLSARIKAAVMAQSWGYPLAFHFDPLVIYDGCEEEYKKVIELLFSAISPENIVWISLGTFRFIPSLKSIIQNRFPDSKIIYGEFISGLDGKMRYFKPLRIDLYKKIVSWIREIAPDVVVYLCMEDEETWIKSLGFSPDERGGLPRILDMSAIQHCGICYEN